MFMYGSFFLLAWLSLFFSYQENLWSLLFCCVSGYTLEQLASAVSELFIGICSTFDLVLPNYISLPPSAAAVFVCGYILFRKYLKRYGKISIHKKSLLLVSLIAIFVDILSGLIMGNLLQTELPAGLPASPAVLQFPGLHLHPLSPACHSV